MTEPMVSCVCCTYGRWREVCAALTFYALQDYTDRELVIFNTHPVPLQIDPDLANALAVRVINAPSDYKSLGQVRALALSQAKGAWIACWDDDDLWLPWHLSQATRGVNGTGRLAWKPSQSWFTRDGGANYEPAQNAMEASIIVRAEVLRKAGYRLSDGDEHAPWLADLQSQDAILVEDVGPWMSYAYRWGQGLHHISGRCGQPGVFEEHRAATDDHGDGRPLELVDVSPAYEAIGQAVEEYFGAQAMTAWQERLLR